MSRRPAGARYPHATTAARDADHTWCPVLDAVRVQVEAGREPWGTLHQRVVATEAEALEAKQGLYRARSHSGRKRAPCHPRAMSVRADYAAGPGRRWTVSFQVWDRADGKREIVRRVRDGEQLAYNVRRGA